MDAAKKEALESAVGVPPDASNAASLPEDVVESALLIGTLFRWMLSHGDGGTSLKVVDDFGLSFLEFKAILELRVVHGADGPCMQEVADATGSSISSMSRAIDTLVRKELVSRIEDPEDRRRRMIALTPQGRDVVNRILMGRAAGVLRLAAEFEPDERAALNSVLSRLVEREDFAHIHRQLQEAVAS